MRRPGCELPNRLRHRPARRGRSAARAPPEQSPNGTPDVKRGGNALEIVVTSMMVQDQEKALELYTEVPGFVKKTDIPAGAPGG